MTIFQIIDPNRCGQGTAATASSYARESLSQYIESRIRAIFTDVAEMVAKGEIDVSEDEAAGIPFALFFAEHDLVQMWRRSRGEGDA